MWTNYLLSKDKEGRERESKGTEKRARQTDPLTVWKLLLVFVRGRRERRFPLERAPRSGEGPRNRLWTLSAGQHSRGLLCNSAPPSDSALKAGDRPRRGPGTHRLGFHQLYTVPGRQVEDQAENFAYITFNHANNPVRLDISAQEKD